MPMPEMKAGGVVLVTIAATVKDPDATGSDAGIPENSPTTSRPWRTLVKLPSKETQEGLEHLFNKFQLMKILRSEFETIVNEEACAEALVEPAMAIEALSQMYLHRQADPETMVGILSPKYGTAQEVANKLLILVEMDYFDFNEDLDRFIVRFDLSDDVKEMLDRFQFPLPMVVKPLPVKDNFDTGYLTMKSLLVLNGSDYFRDVDLCLDHLNRANAVALEMNFDVINSDQGKFVKPVRQIGEDFDEYRKRLKQAEQFYETSISVMEQISQLSDEVYLTHRYDRRGRVYASGYHVNTQGDDYRKAVLNLRNKEPLR